MTRGLTDGQKTKVTRNWKSMLDNLEETLSRRCRESREKMVELQHRKRRAFANLAYMIKRLSRDSRRGYQRAAVFLSTT